MELGQYKELTEVPKKVLPDLITASKAAEMRGVTVFSIWHHVRENRLNFYTVAGVRFLLRSEVENFTKLKPGVKPKAEGKKNERRAK